MSLTRRAAAGSLFAAGLAIGGAANARQHGGGMRAMFHRYVEQFNSGKPEGLAPFFAPDVVLNLPGRELIGAEAIVSHYRRSFAFLTEWLRVDTLIVDDRGLAAELYTRFTAHRDYPDFHALPLKKNDVYIVTTFVLYEFDTRGRFTRIRPALWQRDVSGVRSSD